MRPTLILQRDKIPVYFETLPASSYSHYCPCPSTGWKGSDYKKPEATGDSDTLPTEFLSYAPHQDRASLGTPRAPWGEWDSALAPSVAASLSKRIKFTSFFLSSKGNKRVIINIHLAGIRKQPIKSCLKYFYNKLTFK